MCRFFLLAFFFVPVLNAQTDTALSKRVWLLETNVHAAYIVKNSGSVPDNQAPFMLEINPSVQTNGTKDWHQTLGMPKVGCSLFAASLGNPRELGYLFGAVPNLTFNTANTRWYAPRVSLGLGLALFTRPYNEVSNPSNYYIGSHITAFAYSSVYVQPQITNNVALKVGMMVSHCSNGHVQIPNLGMNFPSVFVGAVYHTRPLSGFRKRALELPPPKTHFNVRFGLGVHELARTLGPAGTPKYAVYSTDFYLSRRFGQINNVHAGLEINHYNSYYVYAMRNKLFETDPFLKTTVFTVYLAHELMIGRFSLLTQGGINVYNRFYNEYIKMYKTEKGFKAETKKIFSTRLGVQYYLLDPRYCTRSNVFIGTYIKANFGQADFVCAQIGFVF
jgi:hypothetical protein